LLLQLQQALHDYYPGALEAFDHDLTTPAAWALIERFPTPQRLQDAGKGSGKSSDDADRNPVERGWVATPRDWRYSSAHEWRNGAMPVMRCDP
jgi:hypothetical protein